MIDTLAWDSPIRRAVEPDWWQFGDPNYSLLADIRDFLGVIAVKTPAPPKMKRKDLPEPVPRPGDEKKTGKKVHAPEPVSFAQLDAELNW